VDKKPSAVDELRFQLCASRELPFRAHVLNCQDAIYEDIEGGDRVNVVPTSSSVRAVDV